MKTTERKKDIITDKKLEKYMQMTEKALQIAEKSIVKGKEQEASEILDTVRNYIYDCYHFKKVGDYVTAFSAISYAHGWLDSGARLRIFEVKDNKLFAI